jgi:hypothetical protein
MIRPGWRIDQRNALQRRRAIEQAIGSLARHGRNIAVPVPADME